MFGRTISNGEMERRKLLAAAQSEITNAIEKTTVEHGVLTANEWIRVLSHSLERMSEIAVNCEWNEEYPVEN